MRVGVLARFARAKQQERMAVGTVMMVPVLPGPVSVRDGRIHAYTVLRVSKRSAPTPTRTHSDTSAGTRKRTAP